jgi:hypothetical protein
MTALLPGIAGTAAGGGIASGHLAKAGLDPAAVLAAVGRRAQPLPGLAGIQAVWR